MFDFRSLHCLLGNHESVILYKFSLLNGLCSDEGLLWMCRLFRDGRITWGRVLTLLCFGYRIAVTVIHRGIRGFFSNVVGFVVRFVFTENIAKWIAEQGGWVRYVRCLPQLWLLMLYIQVSSQMMTESDDDD